MIKARGIIDIVEGKAGERLMMCGGSCLRFVTIRLHSTSDSLFVGLLSSDPAGSSATVQTHIFPKTALYETQSLYKSRAFEVQGIGLFAIQPVNQGQRIMSSRPRVLSRSWKSVPSHDALVEMCSWRYKREKAGAEHELKQMVDDPYVEPETQVGPRRL